jgi:hypothetical protein
MNEQFTTTNFEVHSQHLRELRRQAEQRQAQQPTASKRGIRRMSVTAHLWYTLTEAVAQRTRAEQPLTGELARSHK